MDLCVICVLVNENRKLMLCLNPVCVNLCKMEGKSEVDIYYGNFCNFMKHSYLKPFNLTK